MKKFIAFIIVFSTLAITSCGGKVVSVEENTISPKATVVTESTSPSLPKLNVIVEGDRTPDEPLFDDLIFDLEKNYSEKFYDSNYPMYYYDGSDNPVPIPYYGTYDGYVVFAILGNLYTYTNFEIAGETFYYHQAITIFAYKDGDFTEIRDLYGEGKISDEAIKEIASYHREYSDIEYYCMHEFYQTVPEELEKPVFDNDTIHQIESVWKNDECSPEYIVPLGKYENSYAFMIDRSLKYYTDRYFRDYLFRGYNPGRIFIYRNGEIFSIDDAFDHGFVNEKDVAMIACYKIDYQFTHKIFNNLACFSLGSNGSARSRRCF